MSTPAILPRLLIQFEGSGVPSFTLDEDEYVPPGGPYPPGRASIRGILEAIRDDLGPIRVEIVETDGSTYSDVLLGGDADSTPAATTDDMDACASGFLPGELVAVAVILSEHPASEDGTSNVRLPPAVLARHGSSLMLLGRFFRNTHVSRDEPVNPNARPIDDALVNLGLLLLAGLAALFAILWAAAEACGYLTGAVVEGSGLATGVDVLTNPLHPAGQHPLAYWLITAITVLVLGTSAWSGWKLIGFTRHRTSRDPRHLAGIATARDVRASSSSRALLKRAANLRPSLANPRPKDVGYELGRSRNYRVWSSVEDSMLVLGPPRSGKGLHLVINAILYAPGAVVTTSTRPDNLTATISARADVGPVAVFDPQGLTRTTSSGLRWSPVRGCEDPLTAMIRATGLASATGLSAGGVESGGFWEGKTRAALQALLHAAALDHRNASDLYAWTLNPSSATDAVAILRSSTSAADGWSESLEAMISADPRTRDSIWMGVSLALSSLADPRVLDTVTPREGEEFDPTEFLTSDGTLYLLATGAGAGAAWPLVAAFIEDLVETARHLAARSPGARLDPPLLLALDEISNLSPLPSMPVLMAEGGGTGLTTMPVLQSLAQARDKWGDHAANAIWDAAITKIILGGASSTKDLQDLSALIGERDEHTDTLIIGDHGSRSLQRSVRRVPVMPPETIRTLPFGTGLVLLRSTPPIVTELRRWTDR